MLLSVLAGGAGLNLIGANCLILMDASWNPADDEASHGECGETGNRNPCLCIDWRVWELWKNVLLRQLGKESLLMDKTNDKKTTSLSTTTMMMSLV